MRDLSPAGTVGDSVADLNDLKRHASVTPKTGAWYYANDHTATTTTAMTLNRLETRPFPVFSLGSLTINGFGINVTTAGAAGSTVRFGIYTDDGSGFPGALVRDTGVQALTATTATGVQTIVLTTALVLTPGLYWIGVCAQTAAPTVTHSTASGSWAGSVPYMLNSLTTTPNTATAGFHAYSQTGVTGALPANFNNAAMPALPGNCPRILFRT